MKNSNALEMLFDSYLSPADQIANRKLGRIASEIEMWRVQHNMTQRNFAKFMGVSQVMVSKWESGEYNFSIKTLANLASHLNCSFDGMFAVSYTHLPLSSILLFLFLDVVQVVGFLSHLPVL